MKRKIIGISVCMLLVATMFPAVNLVMGNEIMTLGPNNPPNTPTINGPTSGKPGIEYEYTFNAVDPDGKAEIFFYIDWGDDFVEEWIGPFESGEDATLSHAWKEELTYTIRAKAKDDFDAESNWATLKVSMPKNKISVQSFLLRFWEQHPHIFPLIKIRLKL